MAQMTIYQTFEFNRVSSKKLFLTFVQDNLKFKQF